jgi:hypothetical protein
MIEGGYKVQLSPRRSKRKSHFVVARMTKQFFLSLSVSLAQNHFLPESDNPVFVFPVSLTVHQTYLQHCKTRSYSQLRYSNNDTAVFQSVCMSVCLNLP